MTHRVSLPYRRGQVRRAAPVLSVTLLLAACVDATGPPFPRIEETEFAPSLRIDLEEMTRIGGGIYVEDLSLGTGATLGLTQYVEVSYSLYLADGTLAEQNDDYGYRTGCRQSIPRGLETGVRGMKIGGQRTIIIPGRWGYGLHPPAGLDVPPGAILVFVVEAKSTRPIRDCGPGTET